MDFFFWSLVHSFQTCHFSTVPFFVFSFFHFFFQPVGSRNLIATKKRVMREISFFSVKKNMKRTQSRKTLKQGWSTRNTAHKSEAVFFSCCLLTLSSFVKQRWHFFRTSFPCPSHVLFFGWLALQWVGGDKPNVIQGKTFFKPVFSFLLGFKR